MIPFDPQKVERYVNKSMKNQFKAGTKSVECGSNICNSIMAFFDKNADGIVTDREFNAKTRADFEKYRESLFGYIAANPDYDDSFNKNEKSDYDSISKFFNDKGYFGIGDLSGRRTTSGCVKTDMTIPEQKHKKHSSELSDTERAEEQQYSECGGPITSLRSELNLYDENSNGVDWHIGTFNQNELSTCTLLATLNLLTDDELKSLYSQKTDKRGQTYYEVNFPNDKRRKPIKIYAKDLDNKYIELKRGNILKGFSAGDTDAMLIEMAYIKRYGVDIVNNGASRAEVMNRLIKDAHADFYTASEELLQNGKRTTTAMYGIEWLKQQYNYNEETNSITLPNGQEIKIDKKDSPDGEHWVLILPNGVELFGTHAYSVYQYNSETKEVSITNPHESSTDISIPFDIFKELFSICQ